MSLFNPVNDIQEVIDRAIIKYLVYSSLKTDWQKLYYEALSYNRSIMVSQNGKEYTLVFPDNSGGTFFLGTTHYILKSGEEIKLQ